MVSIKLVNNVRSIYLRNIPLLSLTGFETLLGIQKSAVPAGLPNSRPQTVVPCDPERSFRATRNGRSV
ncbi:hypothetical protein Barb4_02595 [Bacteroidales bacterium Barb4]|nr:hypothetical protein Barb4_02595 [Bacteroidales bacterium Barb4]